MATLKNKKFVYWIIYSFVFVFAIYFSYIFVSQAIAEQKDFEIFKQSWQYVADTNFNIATEIDKNTKEMKSYYEISSPEQFAGLFMGNNSVKAEDEDNQGTVVKVDNVYKLTGNIDLGGKLWSVSQDTFYDIFDGNSFHIQNLTIASAMDTAGIVSTLAGTIKDVYFDNLKIVCTRADSDCFVGGIAGVMTKDAEISNVFISSGEISVLQEYNDYNKEVGGIVGKMDGGTIKNVINNAKVSNGKHIGGIVGFMTDGQLINCTNYGEVESYIGNYLRVGGIVGETHSLGEIKLCENVGNVSSFVTPENNQYTCKNLSIGGIVGYNNIEISQCGNRGIINGGDKVSYKETSAGGIAGFSKKEIKDCFNTGNVKSSAVIQSSTECDESYSDSMKQIDTFRDKLVIAWFYNQWRWNYWHYGLLNKKKVKDTELAYAGGIVGKRKDANISTSYSTGEITGGAIKYSDTYIYALDYKQDFWTAGVHTVAVVHEMSIRKYTMDLSYTYSFFYGPIIGNTNEGLNGIENTMGTIAFPTTSSYDYELTADDYYTKKLTPGLSLTTMIVSIFQNAKRTETHTTNLNTNQETADISVTGDSKLFSVSNVANVKSNVNTSFNNISLKCEYSLTSNCGSKRSKTGSGTESIMSQALNQIVPQDSNYIVTDASNFINTINKNECWKIDASGHLTLIGLCW